MFGVGTGELLLILVIAMLVVGPERMVEFSRTMGRMIAQFRHTTDEATKEFREAFSVEELQDLKKEVEAASADITSAMSIDTPVTTSPKPATKTTVAPAQEGDAPAETPTEPVQTVTLTEVLGDELVDGEIEVAAPTPLATAEAQPAQADETSNAVSIDLANLVPEDPDVEPTMIEVVEMAPQEPDPSPEGTKD